MSDLATKINLGTLKNIRAASGYYRQAKGGLHSMTLSFRVAGLDNELCIHLERAELRVLLENIKEEFMRVEGEFDFNSYLSEGEFDANAHEASEKWDGDERL